ncbi:MAG: PCRF domain-containing protein, partial [Gammaproteobacteria bacterium]|nr:PCRF domain-containing protein [Gammaproteobacteria bacterium]
MKSSIREKLEQLGLRLAELDRWLASSEATADMDVFRRQSREHAEIEPVVALFRDFCQAESDVETAQAMLDDPEMRELAESEIESGASRCEALALELQKALLPRDPDDDRNLFLEIRAGTGGDEAALFAGDLFRMYSRYAQLMGWKVEVVDASPGDAGGFKEIVANVSGDGVFGHMKWESGVHRVQRVPATETQGRIHTSAATVAVLPAPENIE